MLPLVLEDAFKLGVSRDQHLAEQYLKLIGSRIITLPYNPWPTMLKSPQIENRLQSAGYILGSAYIEL